MNKKPLLLNQNLGKRDFASRKKDVDFKSNVMSIFGDNLDLSSTDKKILILTSLDDSEINFIGPHLVKRNIDYIRINAENFSDEFEFSFTLNDDQDFLFSFIYKGKKYNINDFDFIWVRHFELESFFFEKDLDPFLKKYLLGEWGTLFQSIYSIFDDKVITPTDKKITKPYQLIKAKAVGLNVPYTIITNSKTELESYFDDENGKIFAKALRHHSVNNEDGTVIDFYGRTFESLEKLLHENISASPVIYQTQIDKSNSVEYRINVFGKVIKSFIYENVTKDDWHFEDITDVKLSEKDIPETIKKKILQLFADLNLKVGTVDIIKLEDKWYFLEVNTAGDWRWLEKAAEVELEKYIPSIFE